MRKTRIGIVLVAVLALGAACGGDEPGGAAAGSDDGGGSVTLTATGLAFSPPTLEAASGGTIEFVNEDDVAHTFTAEEAGIDSEAEGGASTTVDLGDAEPGTYDFVCRFHPDMKGTLEITG